MGTLFNQKPREAFHQSIVNELEILEDLSSKYKVSMRDLIALISALEARRANDLKVYDGDVKDEQLAGFGDILNEFLAVLKDDDRLSNIIPPRIAASD